MANNGRSSQTIEPRPSVRVLQSSSGSEPVEQTALICLQNPRPLSKRANNVYIDTPSRAKPQSRHSEAAHQKRDHKKEERFVPGLSSSIRTKHFSQQKSSPTVVNQPKLLRGDGSSATDSHNYSILCPTCGRCRCLSCRGPKSIPSRWICNKKYQCSVEEVTDCCSCMCCVKALFYHCGPDPGDDHSCFDEPCSCTSKRKWTRWSLLAVLSIFMPCLCCYWPLRACAHICELCYQRCTSHGCQCPVPSKGVLI